MSTHHTNQKRVSSHTARRLRLSSDMHALAKCMRSIESECGNGLGQAYPAGPLIVRHCCFHSIVSLHLFSLPTGILLERLKPVWTRLCRFQLQPQFHLCLETTAVFATRTTLPWQLGVGGSWPIEKAARGKQLSWGP
jgi:hypothetical protein